MLLKTEPPQLCVMKPRKYTADRGRGALSYSQDNSTPGPIKDPQKENSRTGRLVTKESVFV